MKKARSGMLAFGVVCLIVVLACTLVGFMVSGKDAESDVVRVASVNGEAVEAREFAALLAAERSKVYAYFQDKYGAEDSSEFWTHSFNGENPTEKITQEVLKQLVKRKVQQMQGMQYGLLKDASYSAFLEELRIENERRKKETDNGRPVYGPKQITEKVFYEMRQSQLLKDMKTKFASEQPISDQEIAAYYDAHQQDFKQVEVNRVNLFNGAQQSNQTETTRPVAKKDTKESDELIPLSDVKNQIGNHLSELSFERFVQDQIKQAQLVVNEKELKSTAAHVLQGES